MASSEEFVKYVRGQIDGAGIITYRKMFGDHGVYCDGKIIGRQSVFCKADRGRACGLP